jgi:hypothetical protein
MGACPANSQEQYFACNGVTPLDPDTPDLAAFAQRVGTPSGWPSVYCIAVLRAHRLIYFKNDPGDCPKQSSISLNTNVALASKASGILGQTGLAENIPVVGPYLQLGLSIFSSIGGFLTGAAHARAVANEQATLCAVTGAWNGFADSVEQQIRSGRLSLADAIKLLPSVVSQLKGALGPVNDGQNFGWGFTFAIDALAIFYKERLWRSFESGQAASKAGVDVLALAAGAAVAKFVL